MAFCRKCGAVLKDGMPFCGNCGTRVDEPQKQICPNCHSEMEPGTLFCIKCGAKLSASVNMAAPPVYSNEKKTISITREAQLQCAMNSYRVYVNGNNLGNIAVGKTLFADVTTEQVTIDIVCTTVMVNSKLRILLEPGENTQVSFKVQWPGDINASVSGAKILGQSN